MYGFMSFDNPLVLVLVLVTFVWSLIAQAKVKSAFSKYTRLAVHSRMTGAEAARHILNHNGLSHVRIERSQGLLSDHYDPKADVVRLSPDVHDTPSVAAVSIAAHEVGHALQHAQEYSFVAIRTALLPAAVASSKFVGILFFAGLILGQMTGSVLGLLLMDIAILLFLTTVLFQAVTLPLEFDASKRAKVQLVDLGLVEDDEVSGVKRMLSAAAMTYVAALSVAIAQLIRLIAIRNRD